MGAEISGHRDIARRPRPDGRYSAAHLKDHDLTKTKSIARPQTRAAKASTVALTETQLDQAVGGATFVERKAGDKTNP